MSQTTVKQEAPIICTFYELAVSLQSLHLWNKADLDRLHDVWKIGAPTPDSRLLDIKHYDPRKVQAGNVEKRIVFPKKLGEWIADVGRQRGIEMDSRDAANLIKAMQLGWAARSAKPRL